MLVISDSPTFLLEKISKSNNIQIEKIIAFGPECEKQITKRYGSCLLLITKSFYDNLESISINKDENKNVWETRNKRFKKKIFKIENLENNIFTVKIIVENF